MRVTFIFLFFLDKIFCEAMNIKKRSHFILFLNIVLIIMLATIYIYILLGGNNL